MECDCVRSTGWEKFCSFCSKQFFHGVTCNRKWKRPRVLFEGCSGISMMRFLHIGLGGVDEEDLGTPKLLDIWKNPDRFGSQKFHCRICKLLKILYLNICSMLFLLTAFKKKVCSFFPKNLLKILKILN